jgi:hypothetical protein
MISCCCSVERHPRTPETLSVIIRGDRRCLIGAAQASTMGHQLADAHTFAAAHTLTAAAYTLTAAAHTLTAAALSAAAAHTLTAAAHTLTAAALLLLLLTHWLLLLAHQRGRRRDCGR